MTVDLVALSRICSEHLLEIASEQGNLVHAVSMEELRHLMENLGDGGRRLSEVGLLQVAMTKDPRVDISLKRQLLYGLLLPRGLTVIKEDGYIIAPSPEIPIEDSGVPLGQVMFLEEFGREVSIDPPDLADFCQLKGKSNLRVHQLLQFLLSKLADLDSTQSLLGADTFPLKSYSSVINKLFFRGKKLKDLFAATVLTYPALETLQAQLDDKGAIRLEENDRLNGNGDQVYRYVRILQVELEGRSPFTVPICYEIVHHSFETPVPHEQYELDRLTCSIGKGKRNTLNRMGFTVETYHL